MAKEKCWKCKKVKSGVKLRACDDRLCEKCYEANEALLRQQRGGVVAPAAAVTIPTAKAVTRGCFGCLNTPKISGKN